MSVSIPRFGDQVRCTGNGAVPDSLGRVDKGVSGHIGDEEVLDVEGGGPADLLCGSALDVATENSGFGCQGKAKHEDEKLGRTHGMIFEEH